MYRFSVCRPPCRNLGPSTSPRAYFVPSWPEKHRNSCRARAARRPHARWSWLHCRLSLPLSRPPAAAHASRCRLQRPPPPRAPPAADCSACPRRPPHLQLQRPPTPPPRLPPAAPPALLARSRREGEGEDREGRSGGKRACDGGLGEASGGVVSGAGGDVGCVR